MNLKKKKSRLYKLARQQMGREVIGGKGVRGILVFQKEKV